MHEAQGHIEEILRDAAFSTPRRTTRPIASSITALEGHDLPQPCQVDPLLRQTIFENEFVVQTKGFGVRIARTSAAVASDALLLGTVLPNLVRIAVKYAQSGRRILLDRCHIGAEGEARPSHAPERLRYKAIPPTRSNL
jgi:hypothetical protein